MKQVTLMLKAIHAQESKEASQEKAASIAAKLREMKLLSAAKKVEESVGETLTYMDFPTEHWSRIRTNNLTERVNREIRRRTRAIGAFPDGNSALMLVCARLRHVAASEWGSKRYMDMEHLFKMEIEQPADEENPYIWCRYLLADEMNLRKNLDTTHKEISHCLTQSIQSNIWLSSLLRFTTTMQYTAVYMM